MGVLGIDDGIEQGFNGCPDERPLILGHDRALPLRSHNARQSWKAWGITIVGSSVVAISQEPFFRWAKTVLAMYEVAVADDHVDALVCKAIIDGFYDSHVALRMC